MLSSGFGTAPAGVTLENPVTGDILTGLARIEQRFEKMLAAGFVDEVRGLMARQDLHKDLPAIRAVGYRQVWEHLEGQYDYAEMIAKGVAASRQLAKRQLTWLRNWPNLKWVYTDDSAGKALFHQEIVNEALNCLGVATI